MRITIGSRKSDLARIQAYSVAASLSSKKNKLEKRKVSGNASGSENKLETSFLFKSSFGDDNLDIPLTQMESKGAFTQDFIADLETGRCDMVVHSWKDLPTADREGSEICATLERADLRDVLFLKKSSFTSRFEKKSLKILTSSPRRIYNMQKALPKLLPDGDSLQYNFIEIRGNIPTRVNKFLKSDCDAFIMAKAALDRLMTAPEKEFGQVQKEIRELCDQCLWMVLPLSLNPSAAAQGALAIEIRSHRKDLKELLSLINQKLDFEAVEQERKVLASYGGGCHQKIGINVIHCYEDSNCDGRVLEGKIQYLKGLTDGGEVLDSIQFTPIGPRPPKVANKNLLHPLPEKNLNSNHWFDRVPLESKLDSKLSLEFAFDVNEMNEKLKPYFGIWITKSEALPRQAENTLDGKIVWTAGVKTWEKLAKRGVWVNGTADSLGESQDLRLDFLGLHSSTHSSTHSSNKSPTGSQGWIKLSHDEGFENPMFSFFPTYKLVPAKSLPVLKPETTHYFWSSASQFRLALEKYPFIRDKYHYCGLGNTKHLIKSILSETFGENINVYATLNYETWLNEIT